MFKKKFQIQLLDNTRPQAHIHSLRRKTASKTYFNLFCTCQLRMVDTFFFVSNQDPQKIVCPFKTLGIRLLIWISRNTTKFYSVACTLAVTILVKCEHICSLSTSIMLKVCQFEDYTKRANFCIGFCLILFLYRVYSASLNRTRITL